MFSENVPQPVASLDEIEGDALGSGGFGFGWSGASWGVPRETRGPLSAGSWAASDTPVGGVLGPCVPEARRGWGPPPDAQTQARVDSVLERLGGDGVADFDDGELALLTQTELRDHMVGLAIERAKIEGRYLAAVGRYAELYGPMSAGWCLREYGRVSSAQSKADARLAADLVRYGLSDTVDALRAGEIHTSHAKVIAREVPKKHRHDEEWFLNLARSWPSEVIARHSLKGWSNTIAADLEAEAAEAAEAKNGKCPLEAELELQRNERSASMNLGEDGMWHLHADFDYLTGREFHLQFAAAERQVRKQQTDDGVELSGPQRRADALAGLVLRKLRPQASLVVVADYDVLEGTLKRPRLDDGTPIPASKLAEYAAEAKILPAVFKGDWSQLALGRARNANDAQKIVLAIRDGGCIACATHPERCHAHHIEHYEHGGLTEPDNLALLCEPCHTNHHQTGWTINTSPDGKPKITTVTAQGPTARSP